MRVLIMGAGAIGSVSGGFLAKAGHAVTLVGREAHMRQIRESGLHITWPPPIVITGENRRMMKRSPRNTSSGS